MGLLSDDYYKKALQQSNPIVPPTVPTPQPALGERVENKILAPIENTENQRVQQVQQSGTVPGPVPGQDQSVSMLTPEEQTQKYGGVVGSPEYLKYQSENPIQAFAGRSLGETVGIKYPDQQTWDKMTFAAKAKWTAAGAATAAARMAVRAPRELVKAPVRLGYSIYKPWADMASGRGSADLENQEVNLPWLGKIPTYWKSYDDARKGGLGPLAATLSTATTAIGDVTMAASLVEAVKAGLSKPKFTPGQKVGDTAQVAETLAATKSKMKLPDTKAKSLNEYYPLPENVAKNAGGNSKNTFLKITPATADGGQVEVSIVQTRKGLAQKVYDKVSKRDGVYEGDFGPEVKLQSQKVAINNSLGQTHQGLIVKDQANSLIPKVERYDSVDELFKAIDRPKDGKQGLDVTREEFDKINNTLRNVTNPENLQWRGTIYESTPGEKDVILGKVGNNFVVSELLKNGNVSSRVRIHATPISETGMFKTKIFGKIGDEKLKLIDRVDNEVPFSDLEPINPPEAQAPKINLDGTVEPVAPEAPAYSILPKPLKGFENKPVTAEQITNLKQIVGANSIDPEVASTLMRNVTGKNAVGEMTQAEYVNLSQTLATFNKAAQYLGDDVNVNLASQYLSPQRYWMRSYEEKSGIPLYSDVYVPMEDAVRLRDTFRDGYRNKAREIFGDYAGPKFAEERRLVKAYMEGDKNAVLTNEKLTPQIKSDLIRISDQLRPLYDELGQVFDIPTDVFLKDYQPHVKNIGGVFMVYKDAQEDILNHLNFFADYKRTGSLTPQVDDALALFDIYTNAGSNKKFLNPALERVSEVGNSLPPTLKNSVKSYVGEKLGHAGRLEQFVNEVGVNLSNRLGGKIPPDVGRQMTQFIMDTSYSGALGLRPGAVVRNFLQNPLMTYPRLGSKFYAEAVKKALTAEGRAELARKGFTVDLGVPYGYELVKDAASTGGTLGKALNLHRRATQATLKPYGAADQFTRAATYWQTKFQWEDAIAKLNSKEIDWTQFEKQMDFDSLSVADQNIIRQRVVDGNTEGAFDHLVRDVLDETQFPYRKGASARVTYGLAGKLGTQFGQWNIEFLHTLGNWIKKGQWDKLIRFHAAANLTARTVKDVFGFDISKWTGINAVSPTPAPAVQFAQELGGLLSAWKDKSAESLEEHKEALISQMKVLNIPAGLQAQNVKDFLKSVGKGPDAEGMYPVYSRNGKLKYTAPFKDIWWKMVGFPSANMVDNEETLRDMRNQKFEYTKAKQQVLELWQQEKYDAANDLISEYKIQLSPSDFDAYYIPMTRRSYDALPASLKAKFAPRVFGTKGGE